MYRRTTTHDGGVGGGSGSGSGDGGGDGFEWI